MTVLPRSGPEGREGVVYATRCCARESRARAYQRVRERYASSDPERNGARRGGGRGEGLHRVRRAAVVARGRVVGRACVVLWGAAPSRECCPWCCPWNPYPFVACASGRRC